jgi:hypothetical protein
VYERKGEKSTGISSLPTPSFEAKETLCRQEFGKRRVNPNEQKKRGAGKE